MTRTGTLTLLWSISSLALLGTLLFVLLGGEDRSLYLPGETTWGHHQIELQCGSCHGDSFTDEQTLQNACMDCHGDELDQANDAHPRSKFTDPRNANRLEKVDARLCVSCHSEHRPEMTGAMGVTLPEDYCAWCHEDIAKDRPSHEGMGFDTCASAGCHNYHDNRALYEDFLLKHAHGGQSPRPDLAMRSPERNLADWLRWTNHNSSGASAPMATDSNPYHGTAHESAGVTCASCHEDDGIWRNSPSPDQCGSCHKRELGGFKAGKHGMRLAVGLPPMSPAMAKLPMHADAAHEQLTCNSCHQGHAFDTQEAAVSACQGCHADDHTKAFIDSPHGALWQQSIGGDIDAAEAVSCATCHMPREVSGTGDNPRTVVQHNQNDNLRPNEKMIRPVCLNCHDLQFSLNALADPELIERNFNGQPSVHVDSIDMATSRDTAREQESSPY